MLEIQHPPTALPGVPQRNAFQVIDETGLKCGAAAVVEYVNASMLPDFPLNFYLSVSAASQRAFDMLMGASISRCHQLRTQSPGTPARLYAPCSPDDASLLRGLMEYGFQNDDAIFRLRRVLTEGDSYPNPPVGCTISPLALADDEDYRSLLQRVNEYSTTARGTEWLARMQQEQHFSVLGVWRDNELLGEMILTAYGAEGRVEMLYTLPEIRRRGIGSALLGYACQLLLQNGVRTLHIDVWRRLTPAMALLEANQFQVVRPLLLYPGINLS